MSCLPLDHASFASVTMGHSKSDPKGEPLEALEEPVGHEEDRPHWTDLVEPPAPIAVEAVTEQGRTIWAVVIVRTETDGRGVSYWAELRLAPRDDGVVASAVPRQILDERLRDIAHLGKRLIQKVRVRPDVPATASVGELVERAEGE